MHRRFRLHADGLFRKVEGAAASARGWISRRSFGEGELSGARVIILASLFMAMLTNAAFFSNVLAAYPATLANGAFLASLAFMLVGVNVVLLSPVCYRYTLKPVLMLAMMTASITAYFMDSFNVVINDDMIDNVVKTDMGETLDLISLKLAAYVLLLGVVPSVLIHRTRIRFDAPAKELVSRIKLALITLAAMLAVVYGLGGVYTSFLREHKPLRYYANPAYPLYSVGKYVGGLYERAAGPLQSLGPDARKRPSTGKRKLVVFVIGEGARADRFSLNGYPRETNPLLKRERVISFTNFWACGTSTAVSVPCMFSILKRSGFSESTALNSENLLDVLQRAGVSVLWVENNSDSKGVADRAPFLNYKRADHNPNCDIECRDEGMLAPLPAFAADHGQGDLFIVLHQMGNHGPAYYKRYPAAFERFTPTCRTVEVGSCSRRELDNAYDNAILYTDYFLSRVIQFLKDRDASFATALFYVSDHGESLGENGIYLHALPNLIAPDAQKHVAALLWFGDGFAETGIDGEALRDRAGREYSHDNVFHTVLGLMGVETTVYNPGLDITARQE